MIPIGLLMVLWIHKALSKISVMYYLVFYQFV